MKIRRNHFARATVAALLPLPPVTRAFDKYWETSDNPVFRINRGSVWAAVARDTSDLVEYAQWAANMPLRGMPSVSTTINEALRELVYGSVWPGLSDGCEDKVRRLIASTNYQNRWEMFIEHRVAFCTAAVADASVPVETFAFTPLSNLPLLYDFPLSDRYSIRYCGYE